MLKAIFYARFHPERGPSIIHQCPPASVIVPPSSEKEPILKFSDISSYVIPTYELCNRPLSVCANKQRVLGFPVSLEDSKYARNRFTFNVCFVLDEREESVSWEQLVRKTAAFFKEIEEEDGLLQTEEDLDGLKWAGDEAYPAKGVGVAYTLLEGIMEQLNTYGETCVRVNELHVLNLRQSSLKPIPPKIRAWAVPLFVKSLPSPDEWTWDLTLQRIYSHIDGVKHIQRIAEIADVELKLVKKAIRELLLHDRVILLDIFHFQAIYALTSDYALLVKDNEAQDECLGYVATDPANDIFKSNHERLISPNKQMLITLYQDLGPGISLHDFCLSHEAQLASIDIHRFITFGVIKSFLRRVHKYALAVDTQPTPPHLKISNGSGGSRNLSVIDAEKEWDRAWKRAAFSSGWATPPAERPGESAGISISSSKNADTDCAEDDEKLRKFLDGKHCMDEICVSMRINEKRVIERLRSGRFGEVILFCK